MSLKPLIHYKVGEKKFNSDLKAFQYFTNNLKNTLELKFNFDLHEDWTVEPSESIEFYRQKVCEYIENTYANITIAYSGGTDSETIADAFKRRRTRGLRLLNTVNAFDVQMKTRQWLMQHTTEHIQAKHRDAIVELDWLFHVGEQWKPNTYNQFEKQIADYNMIAWGPDVTWTNQWCTDSSEMYIKTKRVQGRSCMLHGKEKPEICIENGWWCARYLSSMFETPFHFVEDDVEHLYFFVNDICPELPKKLAWAKAQEMERIFLEGEIELTPENVWQTSLTHSPYYERLITAMGYRALSDFLNTSATKHWGWWKEEVNKELLKQNIHSKRKTVLSEKFFDQVITKTVDNRFLDFKHKGINGILTKSYPLFPINPLLLDAS
jgi:hypothetical protein